MLVNDEDIVMLQIFDTAGLDRYDSLQGSYFKGANGFVIVFDYTRRETFENVRKWIEELKLKATVQEPTIVVLGTKKDMNEKNHFKVKPEDIQALQA